MLLHTLAWISIALALASAVVIALDELRRPQSMAIMNVVWPATALYFSVFALWAYFRFGIRKSRAAMAQQEKSVPPKTPHQPPSQPASPSSSSGSSSASPSTSSAASPSGSHHDHHQTPSLTQVALATSHCGAGCTLADLSTEFLLGAFGVTLFGLTLWASFVYDFLVAWTLGILFQYLSIQPMRHLPPGQAILAAIKADTLSILAFQIGMYAWMALVFFVLFPHPHLTPFDPRFWLMMQIAMILGYATAFPMNRWLVRSGRKEAM